VFFRPCARLPQPEPADPLLIARRLVSIALAAAVAVCNVTTAHAALTFSVSVCLDDFEYAIACRERSSLEAARRVEQMYLDDYATGSPAGSLRIWFAVKAEPREQTTFLLEVENRAIEAVFRKLKDDASHRAFGATGGGAADAAREFARDIERWLVEAGSEARTAINWSHDWGARSHAYKPGQALRELARIGNRNKQNADSH